jgi:hypothetical protein
MPLNLYIKVRTAIIQVLEVPLIQLCAQEGVAMHCR